MTIKKASIVPSYRMSKRVSSTAIHLCRTCVLRMLVLVLTIGTSSQAAPIPDVAVVGQNVDNVAVMVCDGAGNLTISDTESTGDAPYAVASGDLNLDSHDDLVVANLNSDNITVLLGDGTGQFTTFDSVPVGNGPTWVALGFLDSDAFLDAVVTCQGADSITVLLGDGSGSFSVYKQYSVGNTPWGATIADLDDDGLNDVVVANHNDDDMTLLFGDGAGNLGNRLDLSAATKPAIPSVADFNYDGTPDIAVTCYYAGRVLVYFGDGQGQYPSTTSAYTGSGPVGLAVNDFNLDGYLDFATANQYSDGISLVFGSATGAFSGRQDYVVGDQPYYLASANLNGDYRPDLVVCNSADDNLMVLLGTETDSLTAFDTLPTVDKPYAVCLLDANGDEYEGVEYIYDIEVSNVTATSARISWQCEPPLPAKVCYGVTPELGDTAIVLGAYTFQAVDLTGLPLNDSVYFDIEAGYTYDDNGGEHYSFVTATTDIGLPFALWGTVYESDGFTPVSGSFVSCALVSQANGGSMPLSTLTDGSGNWFLDLGNLKDSTGNVMSYQTGDSLHFKATTLSGQFGLASVAVATNWPQECPDVVLGQLNVPVLVHPTADTQLSVTYPDSLVWSSVDGASEYDLILGGDYFIGLTDTLYHFTPTELGTFSWQVRATNLPAQSAWSEERDFSVTPYLSTPGLISPSSGVPLACADSILLVWDAVSGATEYEIEIDGSLWQTLADTTAWYQECVPGSHSWRVRACDGTTCGYWSETWAIQVQTLAAPVLAEPVSGTVVDCNLEETLVWYSVPGATSYEWQLDSDPAIGVGIDTSYVFQSCEGGTHNWKVRACYESYCGAWSNAWNIVVAPLGVPVPKYPAYGEEIQCEDSLGIIYSSVTGATGYWIDFTTTDSLYNRPDTVYTMECVPGDYYWRVKAVSNDVQGSWTPWREFSIWTGCCIGIRGNVDGSGDDAVNISDMTYLVAYLFSGGPSSPCFEEADLNADDNINISDMTYLVAFLFSGGAPPASCL